MQYSVLLRSFILLILATTSFCSAAQNIDIDLLRDINLCRNRAMDGTMKFITNYDYPVSIAIPVAELAWGYAHHDSAAIVSGWQTSAAFGIDFVLTYGLKYAINRPRPYATYNGLQPYETYSDQSFPSGHASFAFCAATSLSICYPRWYVVAPAYLWAVAVSYSRLDLGVHYPSDVLAGAIIGAGFSWLASKGTLWLCKKRPAVIRRLTRISQSRL